MTGQPITLRLTIQDPVPGVAYSLQDKKSAPAGPGQGRRPGLRYLAAARWLAGRRVMGRPGFPAAIVGTARSATS